ncbi:MAG TPA: TetR/AcrR family transcriptional regulator [Acidimicrobiales bacterium]|nr:TetR/AcrR family transcriptional regulator [Acidimicrobiales bacterium]
MASRGEQTRRRLLEAAETVFARHGYHEASIVKITEAAGVAQGTFYLYFRTKAQVFEELVGDLNRRLGRAITERAAPARGRVEVERLSLLGHLEFTIGHPALYRIIRQAEVICPAATRRHYERVCRAYASGLEAAMARGEIVAADPEVLAWSLMGIGEMIAVRLALRADRDRPGQDTLRAVVDQASAFIARGLGAGPGV